VNKIEIPRRLKFLLISSLTSSVLVLLAFLSQDVGVIGNIVILSTFIIATPQLLIFYQSYTDLREMEEKFPIFLRDLIENLRSGIAFHKAIIFSSKTYYGKLSAEIKKISHQLSWGMPVDKALNQFATRIKGSKRLYTSIKIIRESFISGGDVVSTLESVSDNVRLLQDSEKEKKSLLDQYVMLMYAISLIFIVIVVAINRLLIPIFQITSVSAGGELFGFTNPCTSCDAFACSVCGFFEGTAKIYFSIEPGTTASYYTSLFFYMALMQSLFSGLVAGQISENSVTAGIKHSLILVGITLGVFSILVKLKFMGV